MDGGPKEWGKKVGTVDFTFIQLFKTAIFQSVTRHGQRLWTAALHGSVRKPQGLFQYSEIPLQRLEGFAERNLKLYEQWYISCSFTFMCTFYPSDY